MRWRLRPIAGSASARLLLLDLDAEQVHRRVQPVAPPVRQVHQVGKRGQQRMRPARFEPVGTGQQDRLHSGHCPDDVLVTDPFGARLAIQAEGDSRGGRSVGQSVLLPAGQQHHVT